jgi:hypothetical protein
MPDGKLIISEEEKVLYLILRKKDPSQICKKLQILFIS